MDLESKAHKKYHQKKVSLMSDTNKDRGAEKLTLK
jgi:hypothetical protein